MEKNSSKLQQTIHDLLEVTRIEKNLENEKTMVSFREVIEKVVEENVEDIERSKTRIEMDFAACPAVYFNPANLKSIVANLLTNGIKYRKEHGQNIIKLSAEPGDGCVQFMVTDNGIGLNVSKHREKLFGIFNRFHNHVEGSGVGLYIVKKLIDDNGGTLEMESAVGVGTTFTIQFKVNVEEMEMA